MYIPLARNCNKKQLSIVDLPQWNRALSSAKSFSEDTPFSNLSKRCLEYNFLITSRRLIKDASSWDLTEHLSCRLVLRCLQPIPEWNFLDVS